MNTIPQILAGLREIAGEYDALICDVWGVLHDGRVPHLEAAEALRQFRKAHGPVVLLSNAPRPITDMEAQFRHIGVPTDCYDGIVTSGVSARTDLADRAAQRTLPMLHLGPERDTGVFSGLDVELADEANCEIVLCTGLWNDDDETPEDYRDLLATLRGREQIMLCANPDMVVQRGDRLIYCAGALAKAYEEIGGAVIWFGKPFQPIYETVFQCLTEAAGREIRKPLAIGDGADTDIKGANRMGMDALFIANGVHASQLGDLTVEGITQLFAVPDISARAAMPSLVW